MGRGGAEGLGRGRSKGLGGGRGKGLRRGRSGRCEHTGAPTSCLEFPDVFLGGSQIRLGIIQLSLDEAELVSQVRGVAPCIGTPGVGKVKIGQQPNEKSISPKLNA